MRKNICYILCLTLFVSHAVSAQRGRSGQKPRTLSASAAIATGSWYGRADVDMAGMHNNYLTELVIRQKGNKVEGIFGYYFRDKYQSIFVHGRYDPKTRQIVIPNIPVIYFNSNSTVNSIDCNTNFIGILMVSKVKTSLSGYFYHDEKYKYLCPDLKVHYTLDKGEDKQDSVLGKATAGERIWKPQADDFIVNAAEKPDDTTITVLRADADTASVYASGKAAVVVRSPVTEPSVPETGVTPKPSPTTENAPADARIADNKTPVNSQPAGTNPAVSKLPDSKPTVSNPPADNRTVANPPATNNKPAQSPPANDKPVVPSPANPPVSNKPTDNGAAVVSVPSGAPAVSPVKDKDSVAVAAAKAEQKAAEETKLAAAKALEQEKLDTKKIADSYVKRKTVLSKELEVVSDSVRVSFYDNGEIDGDSISVFVNRQLVLKHQELAAKALTIYVHLDKQKEINEIGMFAENLGKYPPNTALMVVTDGINRYEVFMSSSLTQNASIRLRRREP